MTDRFRIALISTETNLVDGIIIVNSQELAESILDGFRRVPKVLATSCPSETKIGWRYLGEGDYVARVYNLKDEEETNDDIPF